MANTKDYNIYGKIELDIDFTIEAESEQEAEEKAKEWIIDYHRLDMDTYIEDYELNISAQEYED